jgi:hypothetical protein
VSPGTPSASVAGSVHRTALRRLFHGKQSLRFEGPAQPICRDLSLVNRLPIPGYNSFGMPTIPLSFRKHAGGKQTARQLPVAPRPCKDHSRNTRAGSVRVARQAGRRQAATEVIVITATADANASGSFGLTL